MPYKKTKELPGQVRSHLPAHAQEIYLAAFNSAWLSYEDPEKRHGNETREETAHRVAWAAVKTHYRKNPQTGEWEEKIPKQMN
ncbi:ChaB family protein [Methanogenium organophilum]|uniref:ChaB family protein n=1 Tax=Methanogenium organophilum TaxID=2199 RepID=A0A9X9S5Z7_METOG|nr:ChaB family protein [Methanogenium organophilum]WAI02342.1 ChaB family protein [Methanogenium organophilum]